jgi:hypothetical protein
LANQQRIHRVVASVAAHLKRKENTHNQNEPKTRRKKQQLTIVLVHILERGE